MKTTDDYRPDCIALCNIPVILRNGDRSLKVKALLDDGSTKSYINADVAAGLGLQGKTENVMVNVFKWPCRDIRKQTSRISFREYEWQCKYDS